MNTWSSTCSTADMCVQPKNVNKSLLRDKHPDRTGLHALKIQQDCPLKLPTRQTSLQQPNPPFWLNNQMQWIWFTRQRTRQRSVGIYTCYDDDLLRLVTTLWILEPIKPWVQNASFAALGMQLVPQKCSQNLMPTFRSCLIHSWHYIRWKSNYKWRNGGVQNATKWTGKHCRPV